MTTITPRQLNDRLQQGEKLHLLDVRTPTEHAEIHVPGVLIAQFVHPAFIWLSGFIGAGLTFAGITDWRGLGMLIARLP